MLRQLTEPIPLIERRIIRWMIRIRLNPILSIQPGQDLAQEGLLLLSRSIRLEVIEPNILNAVLLPHLLRLLQRALDGIDLALQRGGFVEPMLIKKAHAAAGALGQEPIEPFEVLLVLESGGCTEFNALFGIGFDVLVPGCHAARRVDLVVTGGAGLSKADEVFSRSVTEFALDGVGGVARPFALVVGVRVVHLWDEGGFVAEGLRGRGVPIREPGDLARCDHGGEGVLTIT